MESTPNILVIKHGALGDIILATAAFAAIRAHHSDANITLLTTRPYAELLKASPYFNDVWIDEKPSPFDLPGIRKLCAQLNTHVWEWLYDLQNSSRTTCYFWLFNRPRPKISSASRWASHTRPKYDKTQHAIKNLHAQLATTGIAMGEVPDIAWLTSTDPIEVATPYALLVPGGAMHRAEKRWPTEHYTQLATQLVARGITPVLIGTNAEASVLSGIAARVPLAVNLCGKTTIAQLADLARNAALAVGNDTGPMHVIAATNCPSTVLFSHASDPIRSAPIGAQVQVHRAENMAEIAVESVLDGLTVPPLKA